MNMTSEMLDKNKICDVIEPFYRDDLALLEIFDSIDSTNTYLMHQAKAGALSGTCCFAEQQTAGRGRLGRAWCSPKGANIYCSFLWRSKQDKTGLSIAVGVMVAAVLRQYGILGVQLKWPNDVLFSHRKLAGILLESYGDAVVIGMGLNMALPIDQRSPDWIDLDEITGQPIARNYFAGLLLNELLAKLPIFAARGLSVFLKEWQAQDILMNEPVTVETPEKKIAGIMRGLDETGAMLLETEQGNLLRFCYGEVSVRKIT